MYVSQIIINLVEKWEELSASKDKAFLQFFQNNQFMTPNLYHLCGAMKYAEQSYLLMLRKKKYKITLPIHLVNIEFRITVGLQF